MAEEDQGDITFCGIKIRAWKCGIDHGSFLFHPDIKTVVCPCGVETESKSAERVGELIDRIEKLEGIRQNLRNSLARAIDEFYTLGNHHLVAWFERELEEESE